MVLSYEEAVAEVTGPGGRFEVGDVMVGGVTYRAFVNAPRNLGEVFAPARARDDATFLVYEDERWSFEDVMAEVDALAAALVGRYGVVKGDRVAIGMRNFPEWIVSFAAITSIGAIAVSLNAWWTEEELDYALHDCTPKVLLGDQERVARAAPAAAECGTRMVAVRADGPLPEGTDRWKDVVVRGAAMPEVEVDPDDDATILYTSGTTGNPKGAVSTHRAVIQALYGFGCRAAVDQARRRGEPSSGAPANPATFILIVPLFHVTGSVAVMLSCFSAGVKLVMMYKWDPDRALELIEREKVTNFVGVPTQSWDLLESPRFSEFDTSSLVSVGGGGAPAPPELVRRVASSFTQGRPNIGYGMTETNAYGPQNNGADYLAHPTSTGRATPILQIEVRDEDGNPLPTGERGEIWFKGPNLIRGYWGKPEATAETIVDGWLRSGDIGRIDDEGFIYVEDRAKDMVLRGGENVYCAEVEAAIYEHPAVYEAAVFGLPHPRLGEEVAAVVYPKPGRTLDAAELTEFLRPHLAPFKIPSRIEIVATQLPRNASGKILKRQLREELAGEKV
ncbi:MAG TPA: class I adenylate-forming enzyme family protein [Acidimicrobiales bacterium]|nr:class I adenylate-forming enzyme family protein [Acidimicrobiales bacterium]